MQEVAKCEQKNHCQNIQGDKKNVFGWLGRKPYNETSCDTVLSNGPLGIKMDTCCCTSCLMASNRCEYVFPGKSRCQKVRMNSAGKSSCCLYRVAGKTSSAAARRMSLPSKAVTVRLTTCAKMTAGRLVWSLHQCLSK